MVVSASKPVSEITLVSEEQKEFKCSVAAAKFSNHLSNFMKTCDASKPFPLPIIKAGTLEKVIEYLEYLVENKSEQSRPLPKPLPNRPFRDLVSEWDYKFTNQDLTVIFNLILAANYLDIPSLLDLCCAKVASEIRGRSVPEIRYIFKIENDFTPEEERQIEEENRWCED